jgi:hypothetical protein
MNFSQDKVYVLDTNVLVSLSLWLPIVLNGNFWSVLEEGLQSGKWVLLDVVVDEIKHDNDGLKKWCEAQKKKGLLKSINTAHKSRAVEINNQYKMIDETTLRSTVDTYLIAYAEANGLVVLSRERFKDPSEALFKIPDVCQALNVKMIRRPREFFEAIGYRN